MRRVLISLAVISALLLIANAAEALPVLDQLDAEDLAADLAAATQKQNICYGWDVTVDAQDGSPGGRDLGSSRGVGIPADTAPGCTRYAIFTAAITYTSQSSSKEDSASYHVRSNLPAAVFDLDEYVSRRGLLGDRDDQTVINAASILPLLVAEQGLAPYPDPVAPTTAAPPLGAAPTSSPGSDYLRTWWPILAIAAVPLLGGLGFLLWALMDRENG